MDGQPGVGVLELPRAVDEQSRAGDFAVTTSLERRDHRLERLQSLALLAFSLFPEKVEQAPSGMLRSDTLGQLEPEGAAAKAGSRTTERTPVGVDVVEEFLQLGKVLAVQAGEGAEAVGAALEEGEVPLSLRLVGGKATGELCPGHTKADAGFPLSERIEVGLERGRNLCFTPASNARPSQLQARTRRPDFKRRRADRVGGLDLGFDALCQLGDRQSEAGSDYLRPLLGEPSNLEGVEAAVVVQRVEEVVDVERVGVCVGRHRLRTSVGGRAFAHHDFAVRRSCRAATGRLIRLSPMSEWLAVLVGAAAVVAGALIGFGGVVYTLRASRRDQRTTELAGALRAYLAAIDEIAGRLESLPPADPMPSLDALADRLLGKRGSELLVRRINELVFGRGPLERGEALVKEFYSASARLSLVAPEEVRAQMRTIAAILLRWQANTGTELVEEWVAVRKRFGDLARQTLLE